MAVINNATIPVANDTFVVKQAQQFTAFTHIQLLHT